MNEIEISQIIDFPDRNGNEEILGFLAQVGHINAIHDGDEAKANARLIAAAPELLEALEWAVKNLGDDLDPDFQTAKTHCELIVKKAKGES